MVQLEPDASPLAVRCRGSDCADLADETAAQRERRDEQLAEFLRPAEARQVVEEVGDVRGDVVVRREEADVLVLTSRGRVVVARADVSVAT